MHFYYVLAKEIEGRGIDLPTEKWFTNLTTVGNVGSVAIFVALDELVRTKELNDGDKILLLVPESGRFSYGVVLLTVKKNWCPNLYFLLGGSVHGVFPPVTIQR